MQTRITLIQLMSTMPAMLLAPLAEGWLAAPFAVDVEALSPPEVVLTSIPPGDRLGENVKLRASTCPSADDARLAQLKAPSFVAARGFAVGELVMAELAVGFVPAEAVPHGTFSLKRVGEAAGDFRPPPDFLPELRFSGPFNARREAAVRLVAQLPSRSAEDATLAPAHGTRGDLLQAALAQRSLLVACGSGNPYTAARERGKASSSGPLHPSQAHGGAPLAPASSASPTSPTAGSDPGSPASSAAGAQPPTATTGAAAGAEPPRLATLPRYHAIFTRASLLLHSCAPNCGYRSVFEPIPVAAPGLQVFAARAIASGEPLSVALTDPVAARPERQALLLQRYGFLCNCPRCGGAGPTVEDDAVAVWCGACGTNDVSLRGVVRPGGAANCVSCGAARPSDMELYTARAEALVAFRRAMTPQATTAGENPAGDGTPAQVVFPGVVEALEALQGVLADTDAGVMQALHAAIPALRQADASGALAADAAAALAAAGDAGCTWVPANKRMDWHVEAGLLLGAAGRPDASGLAWAAAAEIGRPLLAPTAPALLETFAAFAGKPPRNKGEAALADKIRLEVAAWASG